MAGSCSYLPTTVAAVCGSSTASAAGCPPSLRYRCCTIVAHRYWREDGLQLLTDRTAHCAGNADGWILMFNFQTPECESGAEPPSRDQTVQGTRLLARRGASDFVLLEVIEPIPAAYGAYLNGFDAASANVFDVPFAISHPSGDVKKLGIFGGQAVPEGYFTPGDSHWYVAAWDEGMTEGGSSGKCTTVPRGSRRYTATWQTSG